MAKKNSRPNLAARKSASKKAEQQKLAERKAYWLAHRKQIITIAAIVVAAVVALALIIDYCYVPKNTLRTFMGNLVEAKENALIREVDGRYYEFGTVETPEGYAPADYGMNMMSDENETFFYFEAEEEGRAVNSIYTAGVKERDAASMLQMVSGTFNFEEQTENKTAQIGGHEVHYYYSKGMQDAETPDICIASITSYIDTVAGSCVLVSLASVEGPIDELPTEEEMLAEAESIYASLTINK